MAKMSWSNWRSGLLVSLMSGLMTGIMGFGMDASWKVVVAFILKDIAKDGLLYIKTNPPTIKDDEDEKNVSN